MRIHLMHLNIVKRVVSNEHKLPVPAFGHLQGQGVYICVKG